MKLIVDAKALNDALDAPRRLAPRVLLLVAIEGTLAVVADNTIVKVAVRCPADIIESGQACVPASLLFDLAQAMPPGPVTLGCTDGLVELHGGEEPDEDDHTDPVRCTLWAITDEAAMPSIMAVEPPRVGQVAMDKFAESMAQVLPAAPARSPLPVVSVRSSRGALLCAATDSYRLHLTRSRMVEAAAWSHEALIPIEAIRLAMAMFPDGEAELLMDRDVLVLRSDLAVLTTRLSTEKFPSYQKVLPRIEDAAAKLSVNTETLLAALARVAPIAGLTNGEHKVRLSAYPEDKLVTVESAAPDAGQSKATVRAHLVEGAGFSFSTDIRHLTAAAKAATSERLMIFWTAPRKPILIQGFGSDFSAMVMPIHKPTTPAIAAAEPPIHEVTA